MTPEDQTVLSVREAVAVANALGGHPRETATGWVVVVTRADDSVVVFDRGVVRVYASLVDYADGRLLGRQPVRGLTRSH